MFSFDNDIAPCDEKTAFKDKSKHSMVIRI